MDKILVSESLKDGILLISFDEFEFFDREFNYSKEHKFSNFDDLFSFIKGFNLKLKDYCIKRDGYEIEDLLAKLKEMYYTQDFSEKGFSDGVENYIRKYSVVHIEDCRAPLSKLLIEVYSLFSSFSFKFDLGLRLHISPEDGETTLLLLYSPSNRALTYKKYRCIFDRIRKVFLNFLRESDFRGNLHLQYFPISF